MQEYLFLLVLAGVIFAAGCPAGATDCFECGGVGGIPCAATDSCVGAYVEGIGNVACECPPEGCICHCPYADYGALKEQLNPEGPLECPDRCTYGCSQDGTICIITTTDQLMTEGPVQISNLQGEVLVRMAEGGWARAAIGTKLSKGYTIRTGKDGKATLSMTDGTKIFMSEDTTLNTVVLTDPVTYSKLDVVIELVEGALFSDVVTRDGSRFEIDTTVSVFGVKGTKFEVSYDGTTAETMVYEGNVTATSKYGDSIDVGPSEKVSADNSGFGDKQVFDQSVQDKWWEEQSGAGCCAGFAFLASALGMFFLRRD